MLLGEVEVDGEQLVQHQPVIVDRRDVAVGVDLQELGRPGVRRRRRALGVRQPVELHHRHVLEGDAELVGQPDVARGAGAVDAVDRNHARASHNGCPVVRWKGTDRVDEGTNADSSPSRTPAISTRSSAATATPSARASASASCSSRRRRPCPGTSTPTSATRSMCWKARCGSSCRTRRKRCGSVSGESFVAVAGRPHLVTNAGQDVAHLPDPAGRRRVRLRAAGVAHRPVSAFARLRRLPGSRGSRAGASVRSAMPSVATSS